VKSYEKTWATEVVHTEEPCPVEGCGGKLVYYTWTG